MSKYTVAIGGVGLVVLLVGAILISGKKEVPVVTSLAQVQEVTMGAVLSLTGAAANDGNDIKNGIDLAVSELKKRGTVVHVDYQDDATDPKKTISALELLKARDISTVVGLTWGYIASAAIPTVNKENITIFSPANSSDIVAGASTTNRIYYGAVNNYKKIEPTTAWLASVRATNLALIATQDAWGSAHTDVWSQASLKAGARVVYTETIPYGSEADVMPVAIHKIKKQKADAILWTGTEAGAIVFLKELERQNIHIPVLGTNYIRIAIVDGKVANPGMVSSIESPATADFEQRFKKAYGLSPSVYAESAYRMTYQIAEKQDLVSSYDAKGDTFGGQWVVAGVR